MTHAAKLTSYILTADVLPEHDNNRGTFYTGPLDVAIDFMHHREVASSSLQYNATNGVYTAMFSEPGEEAPVFEMARAYGNGRTAEEAWRYALGAVFGPADDCFIPFDLFG